MPARHRLYDDDDADETDPLYGSTGMQEKAEEPWNKFEDPPREAAVGSEVKSPFFEFSEKLLKVVTILMCFLVVLGSAVVSKGTTLFMTSQIRKDITRPYCNKDLDENLQYIVSIPELERVSWIWLLIFAYFVPEAGTFIRSLRKVVFKGWEFPTFFQAISLLITEGCPAIGSAILIFVVLPELDVIKGAMLTNAVCFVPGILALFSRNPYSINNGLRMILDIVSICAQATSFVIWPLLEEKPILYLIPVSVILISVGWWENFVSKDSTIPFIRDLGTQKMVFRNDSYFLYMFMAPIKCLLFLGTTVIIFNWRENDYQFMFDQFWEAFRDHTYNVTEIQPLLVGPNSPNYDDAIRTGRGAVKSIDYMTSIWVFLINIGTTYISYAFGKFACKVMIQETGFAFPINLSVPVLLSGLIAMCGAFLKDECAFKSTIPQYLFFDTPPLYFLEDFVGQQHAWVWLIWLLSQAWITVHLWSPNCDKLSSTEQLFVRPMYDAFLIDQGLGLNRRRHEEAKHADKDLKPDITDFDPDDADEDSITRIYACGTMWHENREEMIEFLKSVMRLDQDQCAHQIVRDTFLQDLKSYYEFETHIFFDDAFVRTSQKDPDPHVNEYVELLVSLINQAATMVHGTDVRVRPPKINPTPYGGRITWTLPGKTKMIAHLKDKKKIRAKKRWSQVMYMYYLLGYKLKAAENLSITSKKIREENTYILALDGDIDFQPEALHLLIDYMKKNRRLGAACGRIHPIGSGAMVWYQMFEYAVGHWLQKATEHVFGCVLCSPGCFSLFRAKALMDKSVMKKYTTTPTEAKHYVQYDQGEDRWLCTLILQRGYRVEYCAASDSFTHAPEGFKEFYNQRRRWMPSTMANIMDLLTDYQHTVKVNEDISIWYIFYQTVLMIGTVIGPGTIFLMLVGSFVAAFGLEQWASFFWNLLPILLFIVVCSTCSSDVQLFFAGLISTMYGLVMMAVFVGVMMNIDQDGFLAPSSLFFFCVVAEFIIAAMLHPKEFNCLKYGIVYYVTVPSMYMLLVIYSVFNMNNVSWGTRDVTVVAKPPEPDPQEGEEDEKKVEKPPKKDKVFKFFGDNNDDEGAWEFSMSKMFKCMFCTHRSDSKESEQLALLQATLAEVNQRLNRMENGIMPMEERRKTMFINGTAGPTILEGSKATKASSAGETQSILSDNIVENSWFYDGGLIEGEVHYLDKKEETFWNELIRNYLEPIEDDKAKVSIQLKELRDSMVFSFLMINSLFVLVVFLLTLKKDIIHLNWPISPKINFTYVPDKNEVQVYRTYLELEPIGFVFLIFFALMMVVQFFGMIVHRFATFSQIITNTKLEFSIFKSSVENLSLNEIKTRDPLSIAKDLQRLKGINNEHEEEVDQPVESRTTMGNLLPMQARRSNVPIFDLKKTFHTRVDMISRDPNNPNISDDRRKSVAFVQNRRRMTRQSIAQKNKPPPHTSFLLDERWEDPGLSETGV